LRLFSSRAVLIAVAALVPVLAQADGLYLKLAAEPDTVAEGQTVRLKLKAVSTRTVKLPATPELVVDGPSAAPLTPIVVRASAPTVTADKPTEGEWDVALPQPGRYRIRARYKVDGRTMESNRVTVEVGAPRSAKQ
jgi:hypothetical protein